MVWLVPCVDVVVAAIAMATIVVLFDVAALSPTKPLKQAWWILSAMLSCCVVLLVVHAVWNRGVRPDAGDIVGVAIFQVGVSFIFGTAWLARRTAREMLSVKDVARSAYSDPLTGIGNRRRFSEHLAASVDASRRQQQTLAVLAIDIDHFKAVNDVHGHAAGDEVLRRVAAALQAGVRASDVVCRIGGEEFAVILRGLDTSGAVLLAERLRTSVGALVVRLDNGVSLRVTISLGYAALSGDEAGEDLVRRADTALYAAKGSGRDCLGLAA